MISGKSIRSVLLGLWLQGPCYTRSFLFFTARFFVFLSVPDHFLILPKKSPDRFGCDSGLWIQDLWPLLGLRQIIFGLDLH
jgi:hypothetical protein